MISRVLTSGFRALLSAIFIICFTISATATSEWPTMRGPSHDGSADGGTFAASDGALAVAWRSNLGPGYSGVTISNGKAFTLFSDGKQDLAIAFDAVSGKELWRYKIEDTYKGHDGSHDGPIATPLIAEGHIFGLTPRGHLFAVDSESGKSKWSVHLTKDLKAEKPFYGFGASPILAGGLLIIEVGAKEGKAIVAFDPKNGEQKWALGDDAVSYQTPVVIQVNGKDQLIAIGNKKLFGIDATAGKILWEYEHQGDGRAMSTESFTPVPAGDEKFLIKSKMDSTSVLQIKSGADEKFAIENVWTAPVLKSSYSIPVYHDGYFYGYNGRILTCVDAKNGELKWRSRPPGDGFLIVVDGHLVVQTKEGTLHIAKATPEGWNEKSQVKLFSTISWTAPSFANGSIFARSQGEIARLEWKTQTVAASTPTPAFEFSAGSKFSKFLKEINNATDKKAAVDQFMASVSSFPFIEWPDQVHFLYRGDASDMGIVGDMIGARREDLMHRVNGTDLFYYSIRLEPDARMNYYFIKNYDQNIPDPHNPRMTYDTQNNPISWFSMPGWSEPMHLADAPEERRGSIETKELKSKSRAGGSIQYEVYLPAGYNSNSERYPTIYMFDGPTAKSRGMVVNTFDNVMGVTARPSIVVLIGDVKTGEKPQEDQIEELKAISLMTATELVQAIDANYRTNSDEASRAIMAGGYSAYDALFIAFSHPKTFGSAACQSAVFGLSADDPLIGAIKTAKEQPLRLYMDWGTYDMRGTREGWDMVRSNREFNTLLREKGYYPAGGEVHDGHGWTSWRNRTDRWLTALFPM